MQVPKQNRRLASAEASGRYMGGLSHWTLRAWGREGKVSTIKLGTRLMFDLDELDQIIAKNERPQLASK